MDPDKPRLMRFVPHHILHPWGIEMVQCPLVIAPYGAGNRYRVPGIAGIGRKPSKARHVAYSNAQTCYMTCLVESITLIDIGNHDHVY